MAYVPGFDHDVFISYAHIDNIPRVKDEDGWVKKFRDELEVAVRSVIGRAEGLSIWRDPALQGSDDFAEKIREAFRTSAIMISVLSRNYVASSWCKDEVRQFCEGAGNALKINGKYRLFKVGLSMVEEQLQPPPMPKLLGYNFFELENETKAEKRFRRTREDDPDQRYWDKLNDLARGIADVLKALKEIHTSSSTEDSKEAHTSSSTEASTAVYLAEVADDMDKYRDQVLRTLEQHGIRVLPEASLSPQSPDFMERVRQDLSTATLSVHMIGQLYGKKISGERSLIHVQSDLATEVGRTVAGQAKSRSLTRLFWTPKDLQLDTLDQTQRAFLTAIENSLDSNSDLLHVDLEKLKERILDITGPGPKPVVDDPLVCITHAPEDTSFATTIMDYLCKQQLSVVRVGETQGGTRLQRRLKTNIRHCDALVICYGQGSADWAEDTALEARTLTKNRSRRPLMCLYDGPPPNKADPPFHFREVLVIKYRQPFDPNSMSMFLQRLRRGV